jgi:hypothetical protein
MKRASATGLPLFDQAASAVRHTAGLECEQPSCYTSRPKDPEFDGMARFHFRKKQIQLSYIVKHSLNPTTLHLLTLLKRDNPEGLLLVTHHVSDRQAIALRKAGINFMDLSGNLFLEAPDLVLWVSGQRSTRPARAISGARAFYASGVQLIFALLTDSNLNSETPGSALIDRPYRDISAATGIAHSTIGWIMADLIRQGFVITLEGGVRHLAERKRLLERWVQAYAERLRPNLLIGRYRPAQGDWWKTATLENGLWSGEVAAALITGELKPGTATIFGASPSHAFVLEHSLQKDPQGTVEFLRPFWKDSVLPATSNNCVHPLLVYADLMSIDDERTHEVAQSVFNRHLRTIFETA